MLLAPRGPEGALARAVKSAVGDAGSVVDQSHGRSVIGLAGASAPRVLASLCRIDLHPRAFGPGRVAVTPLAGLSGILHQRDAVPSYDLIVFATLSRWFAAALLHAAEEAGYGID
jgi:sarcosine oxidase subunit gamma